MITIVEPKEYISNLWGKQRIKDDKAYRLMRYILRVGCDGKVLLHNTVTGHMVVLDEDEAKMIEKLPSDYMPCMRSLIADHFLVPLDFDERRHVINLRSILMKMQDDRVSDDIIGYTILPTTGCNARCYYCFEHGAKVMTMNKETADEVVQFITNHCGKSKCVSIMWFGGEPTIATDRIDQISEGLQKNGIGYSAIMMTNGYLFDEDMVKKAKNLWHIKRIQICVDDLGEEYNRIKSYISPKDDPYERVMRNIGLMLDEGLGVILRMNYDLNNYQKFETLLQEADRRYSNHEGLKVIAHPVLGAHENPDGVILHGSDEWFIDTFAKLNLKSMEKGIYRSKIPLPCLIFSVCAAYNKNALAITPDGRFVKCSEQFGDDQTIGNLKDGITNQALVNAWREIADYNSCAKCVFYPYCVKLVCCNAKDTCIRSSFLFSVNEQRMKDIYHQFVSKKFSGGEKENDHGETGTGICGN